MSTVITRFTVHPPAVRGTRPANQTVTTEPARSVSTSSPSLIQSWLEWYVADALQRFIGVPATDPAHNTFYAAFQTELSASLKQLIADCDRLSSRFPVYEHYKHSLEHVLTALDLGADALALAALDIAITRNLMPNPHFQRDPRMNHTIQKILALSAEQKNHLEPLTRSIMSDPEAREFLADLLHRLMGMDTSLVQLPNDSVTDYLAYPIQTAPGSLILQMEKTPRQIEDWLLENQPASQQPVQKNYQKPAIIQAIAADLFLQAASDKHANWRGFLPPHHQHPTCEQIAGHLTAHPNLIVSFIRQTLINGRPWSQWPHLLCEIGRNCHHPIQIYQREATGIHLHAASQTESPIRMRLLIAPNGDNRILIPKPDDPTAETGPSQQEVTLPQPPEFAAAASVVTKMGWGIFRKNTAVMSEAAALGLHSIILPLLHIPPLIAPPTPVNTVTAEAAYGVADTCKNGVIAGIATGLWPLLVEKTRQLALQLEPEHAELAALISGIADQLQKHWSETGGHPYQTEADLRHLFSNFQNQLRAASPGITNKETKVISQLVDQAFTTLLESLAHNPKPSLMANLNQIKELLMTITPAVLASQNAQVLKDALLREAILQPLFQMPNPVTQLPDCPNEALHAQGSEQTESVQSTLETRYSEAIRHVSVQASFYIPTRSDLTNLIRNTYCPTTDQSGALEGTIPQSEFADIQAKIEQLPRRSWSSLRDLVFQNPAAKGVMPCNQFNELVNLLRIHIQCDKISKLFRQNVLLDSHALQTILGAFQLLIFQNSYALLDNLDGDAVIKQLNRIVPQSQTDKADPALDKTRYDEWSKFAIAILMRKIPKTMPFESEIHSLIIIKPVLKSILSQAVKLAHQQLKDPDTLYQLLGNWISITAQDIQNQSDSALKAGQPMPVPEKLAPELRENTRKFIARLLDSKTNPAHTSDRVQGPVSHWLIHQSETFSHPELTADENAVCRQLFRFMMYQFAHQNAAVRDLLNTTDWNKPIRTFFRDQGIDLITQFHSGKHLTQELIQSWLLVKPLLNVMNYPLHHIFGIQRGNASTGFIHKLVQFISAAPRFILSLLRPQIQSQTPPDVQPAPKPDRDPRQLETDFANALNQFITTNLVHHRFELIENLIPNAHSDWPAIEAVLTQPECVPVLADLLQPFSRFLARFIRQQITDLNLDNIFRTVLTDPVLKQEITKALHRDARLRESLI